MQKKDVSLAGFSKGWALAFLCLLFPVFAVVGGFRDYSPVPTRDMWDAYFGAYQHLAQGDISILWTQQNEHRIVLSRLLFWVDLRYFSGAGIFLLCCNYLFAALIFLCLLLVLRDALPDSGSRQVRRALALVILAMTFSWIQYDNLIWGFQSQFLLAQLLPLSAFFLLHRHVASAHRPEWLFWLAGLLGLLSAGAMANGVLALPVMSIMALVLRLAWWRIAVLAAFSALVIFVYFYHYVAPADHGSALSVLRESPVGVLQFVLLYLGGPAYTMTGKGSYYLPAQLAGAAVLALSLYHLWRAVAHGRRSLDVALLAFLIYAGVAALGTATGRLYLGLDTALNSRYMTPVLMGWSCLLILSVSVLVEKFSDRPARLKWLALVPLLLLPEQAKALGHSDAPYTCETALLAIELGVNDRAMLASIYPAPQELPRLARLPMALRLSVFGMNRFTDAVAAIGARPPENTGHACRAQLSGYQPVAGDPRYVEVTGWIYDADTGKVPDIIHLVGTPGQIVAYALTGKRLSRGEMRQGDAPRYAGFIAYVPATYVGQGVRLGGLPPECSLSPTVLVAKTGSL
jgi:hypothetical protein